MRCPVCQAENPTHNVFCTACGRPLTEGPGAPSADLTLWRVKRTKRTFVVVIVGVAGVIVSALLVAAFFGLIYLGKSAEQINLSSADMPGWTMAYDGPAGIEAAGLVSSSGRSFFKGTPSFGDSLIIGSQVLVFSTEANAQAYYNHEEQSALSQGFTLQSPTIPPVGALSFWYEAGKFVAFLRKNVVVHMNYSSIGIPYSKDELMVLAQTVDARAG